VLEDAAAALGAVAPSASWPLKSTSSASASASDWPKSNSGVWSSLSLIIAAKVRPILLRKPCNGPIVRFASSSSISSGSHCRLATTFHNL
jgi:hypothetical protein